MKSFDSREQEIMEVLKKGYFHKEKAGSAAPGRDWERAVMGKVGAMAPSSSANDWLSLFEIAVWRLAPAACLLVVLLSVVLIRLDFSSEYMVASAFMDDPFGEIFFQSFGI